MKIDKLKLLMGRPILIDEKTENYIYHPKVSEIVDMGEDKFLNICLPYILTKDAVFGNLENGRELSKKYGLLQLFFIKAGEDKYLLDGMFENGTLNVLKDSLSIFFKTDKVRLLERQQKVVINDNYLIDEKEFAKVRKAIQAVTDRDDISVEKPPQNMSERQRDIWEKLQAGRRRKAEKERVFLHDIINIVSFGNTAYISKDDIDNMHYFELSNAYKSITKKDISKTKLLYQISPKFDSKENNFEHWFKELKLK